MILLKRTICFLLCLSMLAALAACAHTRQEAKDLLSQDVQEQDLSEGSFLAQSLPVLLADLGGENRVCSPLSIEMALGMLAEITDGRSRAQILVLLGQDGIESLRTEASERWEDCRVDEDWLTVLPAASLWLRKGFSFQRKTLRQLEETYHAEAFAVSMGKDGTNRSLRDWINKRTKHLLEAQAEGLKLDANTVIALVATLYFKGNWSSSFYEGATQRDLFHAGDGDREADFMRSRQTMDYYRGEHFGAVCLRMRGGAAMWLLLPDEDSSLRTLIDDGEAAALLEALSGWDSKKEYKVSLSLPKFDICSDLSMIDALQSLGVTDVFDPKCSDFSPLCCKTLHVSEVRHAARVKIDEEGCEAAAYTIVEMPAEAALPMEEPETIEFVCDRPFLFAVTLSDAVLFIGAVCDPTQ